jgi:acyl-CoA synthetase (AMP-forming)/AMP-acid ligase II
MDVFTSSRFVHDCIESHCINAPDALSCRIYIDGRWLDYSRNEFWGHVCHYAELFSVIPQRTLILFVKKLDIHLLAAYIGAMKAGHLPAQISPISSKVNTSEHRKKIHHIHEITGFGAVFTEEATHGLYEQFGDSMVFTPDSVVVQGGHPPVFDRHVDALVQFSSGTTGLQKGMVLTHEAIVAHMESYARALRINETDAIVSWLPLYHDMGLIACYLMPLMCGIPFYQMDPFDWILQPDLLLQAIEERSPTICYLPNFAYQVLANKGRVHDLSSIRLWINCSEPARLKSHHSFLDKFPSVGPESLTVCYALAENTFAVSQTLPWHNNSTRIHQSLNILSCGRLIPDVEVRIFNEEESDSEGEIGIRSPFLFDRFLDGSMPLKEGFYLTGDLGCLDENNELFITGRKKDLIIVHGKNIYPQDVEHVSSEIEGVYPGRSVAFGLWEDEMGTEELYVIVERKPIEPITPIKIAVQKAVNEEIGIVPKRVEVVEHMTLVKTSSGKISRARNKEIYLDEGFNLL